MKERLKNDIVKYLSTTVSFYEPIYYEKDDYFICRFYDFHSKANIIFDEPVFQEIQKKLEEKLIEKSKIKDLYNDTVLSILDEKEFNKSIWFDFISAIKNNQDFKTSKTFALLQHYIKYEKIYAFTFKDFIDDLQINRISDIELLRRLIALTRDYPSTLLSIFIAALKGDIDTNTSNNNTPVFITDKYRLVFERLYRITDDLLLLQEEVKDMSSFSNEEIRRISNQVSTVYRYLNTVKEKVYYAHRAVLNEN